MLSLTSGAMRQVGLSFVIRTIVLLSAFWHAPAFAADLDIAGEAAVLMEFKTGKILWQKNKDLSHPPASLTKIVTALVVLDHARLDDIVTVPVEATRTQGGTVRLQAGDRLTVKNLLYAMLVPSANDAAVALALHVGGSIAKFTRLMNQKARALGALQSKFRNATGMPLKGHASTARDLAVIARAALDRPEFRKIVGTKEFLWNNDGSESVLTNSNKLLANYRGAIGVKTGSTKEAGYCLVAAATRNQETYLAVVLRSDEQAVWRDAERLLNHGFKNFTSMSLVDQGETILTSVVNGKKVALVAAEAARYVIAAGDSALPQMTIAIEELETPIAKGEKLGEAVFSDGEKEIARIDLISKAAVLGRLPLFWIFTSGGALLLGLLLLRLRAQRRRRYIFAGRSNRLRLR